MKAIIYTLLLATLSACVYVEPIAKHPSEPALSPDPLHYYTQPVADNLFAQLTGQGSLSSPLAIAVASFVPINSLTLQHADEAQTQLANQLGESMLGHARQKGFVVYDYRLRANILMASNHEQALSRQLDAIESSAAADTILTGTYTQMEDGLMLNARLIRLRNKQVLAAASGYVPNNVFWSQQHVGKRGDKLYRQSRSGEQK